MPQDRTIFASTIFLVMTHGFAVRYLLQTDILPTLLEGGARVVIFSPNAESGHLEAKYGGPQVAVEKLRTQDGKDFLLNSRAQVWLSSVRHFVLNGHFPLDSLDDLWAMHRLGRPAKTTKDKLRNLVFDGLVHALRRSKKLRGMTLDYECSHFIGDFHSELFDRYQPDLVVTTSLGYFRDDGFIMREAAKRGVPTASVILSWDNTTTWGMAGARPDWVIAQNEAMREELINLHDMAPEKIFVEGVAYFDHYFHPEKLPSREEFFRAQGLDPDKRLIFLATQSPTIFPWNPELVEMVAQAIVDGRLPKDCQLWARLHPLHHRYRDGKPVYAHLLKEYDRLKERYPFVVFNLPVAQSDKIDADMPASELELVACLLRYSDVLINHFSTIAVEGCLNRLPTLNLGFDPGDAAKAQKVSHNSDWAERRSHNQRVIQTGGVPVVRSEEELIAKVGAYLADPELDADGREKVRQNEGGPNQGQAGKAIGQRLLSLARLRRWE